MIKKRLQPKTGISILFALLLICLTGTASLSSIFSYEQDTHETQVSTNEDVPANSHDSIEKGHSGAHDDISVSNEPINLYTEIPGVGAFFSNILDSLIRLTSNSENRFKTLANHFPLVFPDLHKVLIML